MCISGVRASNAIAHFPAHLSRSNANVHFKLSLQTLFYNILRSSAYFAIFSVNAHSWYIFWCIQLLSFVFVYVHHAIPVPQTFKRMHCLAWPFFQTCLQKFRCSSNVFGFFLPSPIWWVQTLPPHFCRITIFSVSGVSPIWFSCSLNVWPYDTKYTNE